MAQTELDRRVLLRILDVKRRCEDRQQKIREVLSAAYETTPGDPRFCMRRLEVVERVAQALGIRVINNSVFREVEDAGCALGWEPIRNRGRSLFRCVKLRGQDNAVALAVSKWLRFDPRSQRRDTSAVRGTPALSCA